MKKVLVAGAALLIAGSMVSAATAEVNLSGDARVRYVGTSDYIRHIEPTPFGTVQEDTNGYSDNFNSRIRVKFNATSKGGAFMKARVRFDDIKWDGQGWGAWKEGKNVWADYAFIGVPMGPVTFSGGLMPSDVTKFFEWDARKTRAKLDWKGGIARVIGFIDVDNEVTNSVIDEWDDNDIMTYGLVASFQITDDWSITAYGRYQDDQLDYDSTTETVIVPAANVNPDDAGSAASGFIMGEVTSTTPHVDTSGFSGTVHAQGKVAMVGLEGEIAYAEADVLGDPEGDDGWGGYVQASLDMGAFVPSMQVGFTQNGFVADDDFGFIMLGAAEPITVTDIGTDLGDSVWAALMASYAVSDQFKLAGNLVYYDISADRTETGGIDVRGLADAWELSGSATYVISEGADLTYKIGYLDPSYDGQANAAGISDDAYFGHYLRMLIKF